VPKTAEKAIVVQTLAFKPNEYLMELIFICDSLRRDGCKKITAVIPYLAYARQDEEFSRGEEVSLLAVSKLLEMYCDKIITIDAHLHRFKHITDVMKKAINVSAMKTIGKYLNKNYKLTNPVVIGPDEESEQWAKDIAKNLNCEYDVFLKTRFSATEIEIKPREQDLHNKDVIVIDDIVSTGGTMAEAVKIAKKEGAKRVFAVCTHGLFVNNAIKKITKAGADEILSTNTIAGKIDVVECLVDSL
jgi:ribose-phosphate pyrophosphokinase